CKKAIHCYVMSSGIMVLVLTVIKITPTGYMLPISLLILLISIPIILKFAPMGTKNKPLDEVEKQRYRKITILNLIIECLIITILITLRLYNLTVMVNWGILVTAFGLLLQKKLDERNGGSHYV
ncbi:MAG: accessory gene regulator B family protein, partial [Eubacteriales bacterium]